MTKCNDLGWAKQYPQWKTHKSEHSAYRAREDSHSILVVLDPINLSLDQHRIYESEGKPENNQLGCFHVLSLVVIHGRPPTIDNDFRSITHTIACGN